MPRAACEVPSIARFLQGVAGLAAAGLILAGATTVAPARAEGVGPLWIAKTGHFFVGGK